MNILLVEDDVELARSMAVHFRELGYGVDHCADGESGLSSACEADYQVIILDRMLPRMDGLTFVRKLRQRAVTTPVIYLTTMSGIDDRVQGLEAGGDDYLVKPFAFAELLARVRVLSRRPGGAHESTVRLALGSIELDLLKRSVVRAGKSIDLLPQEFRLLEYFVRNPDRVLTRRMLLENVWGIHFDPQTSVVESHISRLRAKLNHGFEFDVIQTIRGTGYKFLAPN
ncbi:MAG TPA: response regulator transcription factor [Steroidobacteraceae bacterium]|jgi:two-component system OmpR family response regulator|nr:response regulator transcription factor [Steroidobacteraceae bacterium]